MNNNSNSENNINIKKKSNWGVLIGASFLMATSAIGPGFLTQTAVFTETFKANLGFIILLTIIVDFVAQLNIWRVIGVSGLQSAGYCKQDATWSWYFSSSADMYWGICI